MKPLQKSDWFVIFAGVAGLILFGMLGPRVYPLFGVRLQLTRDGAVRAATELVNRLVSVPEGSNVSAELRVDREQLGYLQKTFGHARANELARDSIPVFTWRVKWTRPSVLEQVAYSSQEEAIRVMASKLSGELTVVLDTRGRLVGFTRMETKTAQAKQALLDSLAARSLARGFLVEVAAVDTSAVVPVLAAEVPRSVWGRGRHIFAWKEKRPVVGETVFHVVAVGKTGVVRYNRSFVPAEPYQVPADSGGERIPQMLFFLALVILVIVFSVRRLKADQMDLSLGIWPGVVVAVVTAVSVYTAVRWAAGGSTFEIFISVVFGTLFNVAAVVFLVSVTDSVARDVWPEKLTSWTALLKGRVMNRHVGRSLVVGFAWAGIVVGGGALADWLLSLAGPAVFLMSSPVVLFTTTSPLVFVVSGTLAVFLTQELAYRGFSLSFLRRFVHRAGWLLVAGFAIGALGSDTVASVTAYPHAAELLRTGLLGLLLAAALLRHDLLTVIMASLSQRFLVHGASLLSAGLSTTGWEVFALLAALVVLGVLALRRDVAETELGELEPAYVRRLAERERIRRELEIARHVQQTFLPKQTPQVEGLDVASRCVPAAEVGGDYYDLIKLGPGRLGVVIGDVSGKGIGAAFYMTLTKGFLRAVARQSNSPKEVLVRVNDLFYENAERTRFISMIYGIFDVHKGEFAFARAGHNPLLLRHTSSATADPMPVAPKGLALGLAQTRLFEKVTEESRIRISPGDVFVLYTDGFTEAMDSAENEFGEARLANLLRSADRELSAAEILDLIYKEVQRFSGQARQHDDMTLIVVKVLETAAQQDE